MTIKKIQAKSGKIFIALSHETDLGWPLLTLCDVETATVHLNQVTRETVRLYLRKH